MIKIELQKDIFKTVEKALEATKNPSNQILFYTKADSKIPSEDYLVKLVLAMQKI